ncbi:hypothetical protein L3Q82_021851 [Scortum barcoo]|uniref:Uncharacterized protein n=1 Tax=Scortum barcoo TaxID=214431 RepID=A0ACB8X6N1_9TELE|nr:hypothetical protein L3Q82_021851 [Scortum barcoo]
MMGCCCVASPAGCHSDVTPRAPAGRPSMCNQLFYISLYFSRMASLSQPQGSDSGQRKQQDLYLGFLTKKHLIMIGAAVGLVVLLIIITVTAVEVTKNSGSTTVFSTGGDMLDFLVQSGDINEPDGLLATWFHRANKKEEMNKALASEAMILEADVTLDGYGTPSEKPVPIMAHPPDIYSDNTLDQWLDAVLASKKSIKLDFKTLESVGLSLNLLFQKNSSRGINRPVWLNADILLGPGVPDFLPPVNGTRFLELIQQKFPDATVSPGWKVLYVPPPLTQSYTRAMVEDMYNMIKDIPQRVTFPVHALLVRSGWQHLSWLLSQSPRFSLTLWQGTIHPNISDLLFVRDNTHPARVYYDIYEPTLSEFKQATRQKSQLRRFYPGGDLMDFFYPVHNSHTSSPATVAQRSSLAVRWSTVTDQTSLLAQLSALQDCFECTDWEVFKEGTDLDGYTSSVLSYLKFFTDAVLPTKTIKVFPNQKPWLDSTVKPLLKACDAAYRSGDKLDYSIAWKELKKGIKLAKSRAVCSAQPSSLSSLADDTTIVGLISDNDETHYREEIQHLTLSGGQSTLLSSSTGEAVEHRVNNIKFLGIHITSDLTWSMNTAHLVKKAQQRLFFLLRKLKRAGPSASVQQCDGAGGMLVVRVASDSNAPGVPVVEGSGKSSEALKLQNVLQLLGQRADVPWGVYLRIHTQQLLEASLTLLDSAYSRDKLYRPVWISMEALQSTDSTKEFISAVERLFPHITLVLTEQKWPPVISATVTGLSQRVALQLNTASLPEGQEAFDSLMGMMDRYDLIVEEDTQSSGGAFAVFKGLMAQHTGRENTNLYVMSDQS